MCVCVCLAEDMPARPLPAQSALQTMEKGKLLTGCLSLIIFYYNLEVNNYNNYHMNMVEIINNDSY